MRVLIALAALLASSGCGQNEKAPSIQASEGKLMSSLLEKCVRENLPSPWTLKSAYAVGAELSVRLEASSDALDLEHADGDFERQRIVSLAVSQFKNPLILNFTLLDENIRQGFVVPAAQVRGVPADKLLPFEVFKDAGRSVLLVDQRRDAACIDYGEPDDRPNPFLRCELRFSQFGVGFTVPTAAIADIPRLFENVRAMTKKILVCLEQVEGEQHG